jgi:hypothetical protein
MGARDRDMVTRGLVRLATCCIGVPSANTGSRRAQNRANRFASARGWIADTRSPAADGADPPAMTSGHRDEHGSKSHGSRY